MKKKKCVYIFELENGIVKIGITGDLDARRYTISTKTRMKIKNVYNTEYINRKIALSIERKLHGKFVSERLEGEYFKLDFCLACDALDSYSEEIENAIKQDLLEDSAVNDFDSENLSEKLREKDLEIQRLKNRIFELEINQLKNEISELENKMARLEKIINF